MPHVHKQHQGELWSRRKIAESRLVVRHYFCEVETLGCRETSTSNATILWLTILTFSMFIYASCYSFPVTPRVTLCQCFWDFNVSVPDLGVLLESRIWISNQREAPKADGLAGLLILLVHRAQTILWTKKQKISSWREGGHFTQCCWPQY